MIWREGRQHSGYYKIKVLESKLFKFDLYLLKFHKGARIQMHYDKAPEGFEHHRANLVLNDDFEGGKFHKVGQENENYGRLIKFRPDKELHEVSEVTEGIRYVLSLGWLRRKND